MIYCYLYYSSNPSLTRSGGSHALFLSCAILRRDQGNVFPASRSGQDTTGLVWHWEEGRNVLRSKNRIQCGVKRHQLTWHHLNGHLYHRNLNSPFGNFPFKILNFLIFADWCPINHSGRGMR